MLYSAVILFSSKLLVVLEELVNIYPKHATL